MTTTPPVWCATRLRYAPDQRGAIVLDSVRIEMGLAFSSWAGKVRSRKPGPCSMFEYFFAFSAPLYWLRLGVRKVDESGLNGWVSGFNGNLWLGRKNAVWLRKDPSAALGMTVRVRFLRYGRNDRSATVEMTGFGGRMPWLRGFEILELHSGFKKVLGLQND